MSNYIHGIRGSLKGANVGSIWRKKGNIYEGESIQCKKVYEDWDMPNEIHGFSEIVSEYNVAKCPA